MDGGAIGQAVVSRTGTLMELVTRVNILAYGCGAAAIWLTMFI